MEKHPFLSPAWVSAAEALRKEHEAPGAPVVQLKMNLVVEDVPFGEGRLDAHVDTTAGTLAIGLGHLEVPDVKVALDYDTAKAILVQGDTQAGMAAFMAGKVRVEGDMTKLLGFQAQEQTDRQQLVARALQDITE